MLAGIFLAVLALLPQATAQEVRPSPPKVVVIPIRGEIASPQLYILRRGVKEAIENKVDTVVLDMETPGGALDVTFEMIKALDKFHGKTITFVHSEAISAGSLIAAATDEIYFAPDGVIGAAAPVLAGGGEIDATMHEKIVSYLRAKVRSISTGKGYRGDVISSMIDSNHELKIGDEILKQKGELLSLTAQEAMKPYGNPATPLLGAGIAVDTDDLLKQIYGTGNFTVKNLEITWSEQIAKYLNSVLPVLIGLGLMALFIEFKTPGFGVFGITGIALMGLVFFSQFIAGLSGHEPALFFMLGLVLITVELFFFPGVFVMIISGAVLVFGSLVWAMVDYWPSEAFSASGDLLVRPLTHALIGCGLAVLGFMVLLRFLPHGGPWDGFVLQSAIGGPPVGHLAKNSPPVGATGRAVTALFPSGQVEIAGQRHEARVDVGHVEAGASIIVTGKTGFSLTVEVVS